VLADEDQLLVEPAKVGVTPRAIQCDAPLEHRSRDVQASRYDALKLADILGADVDDGRAVRGG
jgi:hypothetical protein